MKTLVFKYNETFHFLCVFSMPSKFPYLAPYYTSDKKALRIHIKIQIYRSIAQSKIAEE